MDASREFSCCDSCGLEYTVDTMRDMLEALGTVELNVKGVATEDALIKRARLSCEDQDWNEAKVLVDKALTVNPENGDAYLVKLMVDTRSRDEQVLPTVDKDQLSALAAFQRALQFGSDDLRARLASYRQEQESRWRAAISAAQVGSEFTIGADWRALCQSNGCLLVIRKDILNKIPYHEQLASITWEGCTLRNWLNTEYLDRMPPFMASRIVEVTNQNPVNPAHGTSGGNPTRDKVFLLSIDEANYYFKSDNDRKAQYQGSYYWWWLRSPGNDASYAADVDDDGYVDAHGYNVSSVNDGVRPALWLNL